MGMLDGVAAHDELDAQDLILVANGPSSDLEKYTVR